MAAPETDRPLTPDMDPRHPDTQFDRGVPTPALPPEAPSGLQGVIPPTFVEPVSSVPNSTFASRARNAAPQQERRRFGLHAGDDDADNNFTMTSRNDGDTNGSLM